MATSGSGNGQGTGGQAAARAERAPFFYGWVIVAVATGILFATGPAQSSVISVFIDPISRDTGWSRALISGAFSFGTIVSALVTMPAGPLLDRFGARWLVPAAGLGLGIGVLGLAAARTPLALFVFFALIRLTGIGVLLLACTTVVAKWFIRKRGRASAITTSGLALGIVATTPLAQYLILAYGWRTTMVLFAIAIWLLIVLPGLIFLRRRPEDMGLRPDGGLSGGVHSAATPTAAPEPSLTFRQAVRTSALWLLLPALLLWGMTSSGITFHLVPFLLERGVSPLSASGLVSFYAIFMISGSMFFGLLAEKIPVRFGLVSCYLANGTAIVILLLVQGPALSLYPILYGVSTGGMMALEPVLWANYYGRSSLGTIRGLTWPTQMVGFATGPFIAGLAYDLMGSYLAIFMAFAGAIGIAILLTLSARPPLRRLRPA